MKLLFVGYLHGFGGAEKMIIRLSNEMANRGHLVTLIGMAENNPCYQISDRVKYIFISDNGKNNAFKIVNRYIEFKKEIDELEPDLIINFWLQSAYMCAFMGKKYAQKAIYSERGDPYDKEYRGIRGIVRNFTFKRINGFVFQTEGAQKYFDESVIKRSCVIANPVFINAEKYPELIEREKRIVNIGRLCEQKNQKLFIDAISILSKNIHDYKVEIYGDGELKEDLQQQIDSLGLSEQVKLMGTCINIHEQICNASLFVLTSDYEGLPNALLEAMALGVPCISTDCRPGGAREIIDNGVNGIIVPVNDVIKLTEAMEYMLIHKNEARKMGFKAKNICNTHSKERIVELWNQYINKIDTD